MKKHLDDGLILAGCLMVLMGTWQACPVATWFVAGFMAISGGIVLGYLRSKA